MRVINLFGGPGSGKSTLAAEVFARLQRAGNKVELVTEYVKHAAYEGRHGLLTDQLYILAQQQRRQFVLDGQVPLVVTDSPLLLSAIYAPDNYLPSFRQLCREVFDYYDNVNIVLDRTVPYQAHGRFHTKEEATDVDEQIWRLLIEEKIPFTRLDPTLPAAAELVCHYATR